MAGDKIKDAKTVKKNQRNAAIIALVGFVALVMVGLHYSDQKTGIAKMQDRTPAEKEVVKNYATPMTQVRDQDKWMAEAGSGVAKTQSDVERLEKSQQDLTARLEAMQKQAAEGQGSGIGSQPLPGTTTGPVTAASTPTSSRSALANTIANGALPPPPPPPVAPAAGTPVNPGLSNEPVRMNAPAEIQEIDLSQPEADKQAGTPPADKPKTIVKRVDSFVTAGSFAKVVLLGGFDAPTGGQAANQALPVVMRVKSFFNLPNFYRTNLKECFITGNAYGDLASERAFIRTSKMSCVMRNGNVLEVDVKGHVNGEDGSFGMRGKVVSKQGQLLAKSFFAGLFAGLGNSIAQQTSSISTSPLGTTQTFDPNKTIQAGLGTGASTAGNKLGDFYLAQANTIFPIIEISAERIGEVYLMEGVDFGTALVAAEQTNIGG